MKPGDTSKMGIDNIDSMIDQAIDDLFVPNRPAQKAEEAPPPPPEPPKEEEKSLDLEISWEKKPEPAKEPETLLFAEPPPAPAREAAPAAERSLNAEPSLSEGDEEEGAPKMTVLKPLYEKLLSLDWEITSANISAVEQALADLSAQTQNNMFAQTGIKMTAVCCKYLRASKTLASPLAMKFLRSSLSALDIFLQPPGPGMPAKEALVNELMGLYNDMKEDANRLRAAALRQRQAAQQAAAPAPAPAPAPAFAAEAVPQPSLAALAAFAKEPAGEAPANLRGRIAEVKAALRSLLEAVEKIERDL